MADTNSSKDWEKREVGALWTKTSQSSGKKYFSGHFKIETEFGEDKKIPVVAFFNKDKKSENSPDFRIYLSRPAPVEEQGKPEPQAEAEISTQSSDDGDALL